MPVDGTTVLMARPLSTVPSRGRVKGGTPPAFPPGALCGLRSAIRERFPVEPDAEITAEANPGTVTAEGLRTMREGGFIRVSIGGQSFTPATLRTLGRLHGVEG